MPTVLHERARLSKRALVAGGFVALGIGVLVGAATYFGQGVMPGQWNTLVNSGAIWAVPPFFVGWRVRSRPLAAAAGMVVLLATVASYYTTATLAGNPASPRMVAIWLAVGLAAGPVYGVGGHLWHDERRRLRVIGVALLGGVFVAEGLYLLVVLRYAWSGGVMLAVGVIATVLLARRGDRLLSLLVMPVPAVAAGCVYGLLYLLL